MRSVFTHLQLTPSDTYSLIRQMISPAFTIAILASIESLPLCVVSDGMIGS
ncbi:Sulfate permease [Lactococcus sp. DD01]|nr:Sulfate permease [Lactococcus sp. DD01]